MATVLVPRVFVLSADDIKSISRPICSEEHLARLRNLPSDLYKGDLARKSLLSKTRNKSSK